MEHPSWCDPTRCTADPTTQIDGYRPGAGGEHLSVLVPLQLTACVWLPARSGAAWLSEAVAPWPCAPYLNVCVGETELSMPAGDAALALSALLALADLAQVRG
ncbi:hypothetical protein GCM10022255_041360 [Dactylosporangium darangshiense]|uniref:Uncharacterized protein n=1 Tax=Dactylosporangium darangshiense TaxID=579108 RepID=A0ABP8D9Y8_9ACTN